MPLNIQSAIDAYTNHALYQQHLSQASVTKYLRCLLRFHCFVLQHYPAITLESVKAVHLDHFVNALSRERHHSKATTALTVTILRSFFRYCVDTELLLRNPASKLRQPRRPDRIPITLTEQELATLLAGPVRHNTTNRFKFDFERRDTLIVKLFAFTGIRRAELSALDWGHIDFDRRQLKVEKGKGEKDRMVPLLPEIAEDLRCFKEHNRAGDDAPVFVGLHGKRLAPEAITAIFQRYVQKRLSNKSVTPHVLRATVATLLLNNGSDLFTISKILGHSRLETTKRYLRTDEQQLFHAMEKHPLNKQPVTVQLPLGI